MTRSSPIGVFDSGLGGLTVFQALRRRLPRESFLYFGDTAHVPYGNKSRETVTRYSLAVGRFLQGRGVKALVVACNTASALALEALQARLRMPVLGVIEPGVRAAAALRGARRVGVIATEATIASGAYQRRLKSASPGLRVLGVACPLFVPLVEEGWWSRPVTRAVAREYLSPLRRARLDALILGCTHYPLLKPVLRAAVGSRVRIIDSAEEAARETESLLARLCLAARSGRPRHRFFTSDGPERFHRMARRLLGVGIGRVEIRLLCAAAFAACLLGCATEQQERKAGRPFEEMTLQNLLRWPKDQDYIEGTGTGRPPDEEKDAEKRRKAARDEAALQAQKRIIAQLESLVPRGNIREILRRAEVVRLDYGYDDACTVVLRVPKEAVVGAPPVE